MSAPTTGYADVNGLHLYYETHGTGSPLVLLHGGMLTIDLDFGALLPGLARRHRVIAVELQGHGRTADSEREISPAAHASDVVALLDHLGIDRAHVLGHSMGAAAALELAVSHPDRVRSVVPVSVSVRPDGLHEDLTDPARMATSDRLPTAEDFAAMRSAYEALSPHPERFDAFLQALSANQNDSRGWTDQQLAGITAPVLVINGDRDFVTVEHAGLIGRLIPGSRIAILPGCTHMDTTRRPDLVLPMLAAFLD
jgi:pimeloyl-ACP methyl ester carboxylesterase